MPCAPVWICGLAPQVESVFTAGKKSTSTRESHFRGGGLGGTGSWEYRGCWCSVLPSLDPCKYHFHKYPAFCQHFLLSPNRVGAGKQRIRNLESEGGFSTGYHFSGSQLSSPLGSNKESELLPHSFEYFFNDGTFVLSVVTSKFWKQQSPFTSNKAGPIITYTWRMGFVSQGGVMPCFI